MPQKNHFITIFLSLHQISHWPLSPSMQPFQTQSPPLLSAQYMCNGWNYFHQDNTVILIPTGPQQRKKAGTYCCGQGSAASCQPPRRAPLHSLHRQDPAAQTERLSHVCGFLFPTKSWPGRASQNSQLPGQTHMLAIHVNYILQFTSLFGKVSCHLALNC